jgi:hypothetical protein
MSDEVCKVFPRGLVGGTFHSTLGEGSEIENDRLFEKVLALGGLRNLSSK